MAATFIAATGQNVGKTTICLGLYAALKKKFRSVGLMKPVGQQHVAVTPSINVDKDVLLFHEVFGLRSNWSDMSPVIIPQGFTKRFLNGEVSVKSLEEKILSAFCHLEEENDFSIIEGTGHVGVGSIVDLSNAKVAKLLGVDIILIANGGIGSTFDELALNVSLCNYYGVKIRGVILNRVLEEKRASILSSMERALSRWNIPLIGAIPFNAFLSSTTMSDFAQLFETELLTGEKNRLRHFTSKRLVAGSLESYLEEVVPNELVITPASREDIIRSVLTHVDESGLILTGRTPPSEAILRDIARSEVPTLFAPKCSYDAMKEITSFVAKIRKEDLSKVRKAIELVETYVDLEKI